MVSHIPVRCAYDLEVLCDLDVFNLPELRSTSFELAA